MPKRLTKTQISDLSGIHIGRTSYYFKHFPEYFEEYTVKGKIHPVYNESAVEIVKLIADMIGDHSHNEIREALNEAGYSPVIEMIDKSTAIVESSNVNDLSTIEDLQKNIETQMSVISTLTRMNQQQADIIDKLEQDNQFLRSENEELQNKVDKQNKPSFLDRFKRKPSDE